MANAHEQNVSRCAEEILVGWNTTQILAPELASSIVDFSALDVFALALGPTGGLYPANDFEMGVAVEIWKAIVEKDKMHPHFQALLDERRSAERRLIQTWADGLPDRDGKFVQEFQTTFNSSFWELYLHAVFKAYGFSFDWEHPSPDFNLSSPFGDFTVEAVTANAADGKAKEWEKSIRDYPSKPAPEEFHALNKEAMIRISSALLSKLKAYSQKYSGMTHVWRKPFVIAVAPFEQPRFQFQYDRPIRAVLYDHYVDEDAFNREPSKFASGRPPAVKLGFIEKDNGSLIPLGIFNDGEWSEVSAVIFSCTATMGKVDMVCHDSELHAFGISVWGGKPSGAPYERSGTREECGETLVDGLQVYHNPTARYPLDPKVFRRSGVVQHYWSNNVQSWVYEEIDNCLQIRGAVLCSNTPFPKGMSRLHVPRLLDPGGD